MKTKSEEADKRTLPAGIETELEGDDYPPERAVWSLDAAPAVNFEDNSGQERRLIGD